MMEKWSDHFPLPEQSGYSLRIESPTLIDNRAGGGTQARNRYERVRAEVQVRWFFPKVLFGEFEKFFRETLRNGTKWFEIDLAIGSGVKTYVARFVDGYSSQDSVAIDWVVSAVLEVEDLQLMDEWEFSQEVFAPPAEGIQALWQAFNPKNQWDVDGGVPDLRQLHSSTGKFPLKRQADPNYRVIPSFEDGYMPIFMAGKRGTSFLPLSLSDDPSSINDPLTFWAMVKRKGGEGCFVGNSNLDNPFGVFFYPDLRVSTSDSGGVDILFSGIDIPQEWIVFQMTVDSDRLFVYLNGFDVTDGGIDLSVYSDNWGEGNGVEVGRLLNYWGQEVFANFFFLEGGVAYDALDATKVVGWFREKYKRSFWFDRNMKVVKDPTYGGQIVIEKNRYTAWSSPTAFHLAYQEVTMRTLVRNYPYHPNHLMTWKYVIKLTVNTGKKKVDPFKGCFFDLSQLDSDFWDVVAEDGGDIRIASSFTDELPFNLVDFDKDNQKGHLIFEIKSTVELGDSVYLFFGKENQKGYPDLTYLGLRSALPDSTDLYLIGGVRADGTVRNLAWDHLQKNKFIYFDGATNEVEPKGWDYIKLSGEKVFAGEYGDFDIYDSFTLHLRFKLSGVGVILDKRDDNGVGWWLEAIDVGGGEFQCRLSMRHNRESKIYTAQENTSRLLGTWSTFAVVFDAWGGGNITFYTNGSPMAGTVDTWFALSEVGEERKKYRIRSGQDLVIGSAIDGSNAVEGTIGHLAIYREALSSDEIETGFNNLSWQDEFWDIGTRQELGYTWEQILDL